MIATNSERVESGIQEREQVGIRIVIDWFSQMFHLNVGTVRAGSDSLKAAEVLLKVTELS
jgi:hypothetical protein